MSRNKYILYIALLLVIVLAIAFAGQVRNLQKQLRSSVRIIPGESKSREAVAQNELEQNVAQQSGPPEILVKFREGVSEAAVNEITARFHDHLLDEIEAVPGLTTIDDPDNADAAAVATQYAALPEVEYAESNFEIDINQANNETRPVSNAQFAEQWALSEIDVPQAWVRTRGSSEIVVAILDSGVEYTHVDLVNSIWTRPPSMTPYRDRELGTIDDVHGYNAVGNNGDPMDENGQGTSCAGIIGADCGNNLGICGVNWKIQIMPLKFLNAGGFGKVADAVEAINYAIDRKRAGVNLRVINASWGLTPHSRALEDVIRKAYDSGILFVAASGDANTNNDTTPRYPAGYSIGNIIAVAATDRSGALAQFSNYGAKSVHIAAPGTDILTTALGNDYEQRSETSIAVALVAGVAALGLSAHPNLSVDQLRSLLLESVDKLPGLHGKVSTSGRINAAKAVGH